MWTGLKEPYRNHGGTMHRALLCAEVLIVSATKMQTQRVFGQDFPAFTWWDQFLLWLSFYRPHDHVMNVWKKNSNCLSLRAHAHRTVFFGFFSRAIDTNAVQAPLDSLWEDTRPLEYPRTYPMIMAQFIWNVTVAPVSINSHSMKLKAYGGTVEASCTSMGTIFFALYEMEYELFFRSKWLG